MVWEGIRYDDDSPLDKVWKKIKLVGGSLGFTPAQMRDKLKLCVHPNLYASVMDLTNEQKILEIARQWSAFTHSRSGGSEPVPQSKPTVKQAETPAFMASFDSFQTKQHEKSQDKKWKKRYKGMEDTLQTMMKAQADLTQALLSRATGSEKPYK